MQIINEVKRILPFKDLNVGDTFILGEGHYLFMKTMSMMFEDELINTIVLNDGAIRRFHDDTMVTVVECETRIIREGW